MSAEAPIERVLAQVERLIELDAASRAQALLELKAVDAATVSRVEALLAADARAQGVLDDGLAAMAPRLLDDLQAHDRDAAPRHAEGQLIGVWRLRQRLGAGGMGEVWLADRDDGQFEQQAAVKLLKRGMDTDGVLRRFRRERQILARLDHPGIARLLDGGMTEAGLPYFAMEYIRGTTLTTFAARQSLDARACARLAIDLCEAVDYAHRRLVIHRDLKPANVLVDDDGSLKVLDFGIAKLLDQDADDRTETGTRVMSPAYASPEQLLGEPVAVATDVYAVGLVLFELLAGTLPHERASGSLAKVGAEIQRDATVPPGIVAAQKARARGRRHAVVDRELDLIVLQALRREPERRYPSALALADDLRRWLERRPIRARPGSLGYRAAKFVARNRMTVAVAALATVVVLVALWASLAQRKVAVENARVASAAARRAELSKQFLVSMFDRADAFSSANHGERTVVDLLEATPARLEKELAGEPLVRAELLLEVGSGLRTAGRRESANAAYRQALQAIAPVADLDPILHAKALLYTGYTENDLGRTEDARAHFEQALAIYQAAGDDRRRERISVKTGLARNASMRGDLAQALRLREEILVEREQLSGQRDPDYAMDLMNLSTSLMMLGRATEAEAALRRSHAVLVDLLGPNHLRSLTVLRALAAAQLDLGRLEDARASAELSLRGSDGNAAANTSLHPIAHSVLARVALYENRLDDAERHARAALAGEPNATTRGAALRNLGRIELAQNRLDAAVHTLQQALDAYAGEGATSRLALWTRFLHREALRRAGAGAGAAGDLESVREAYAALSASEGTPGVEQFEAALMLGAAERESGAFESALALHRQAFAMTGERTLLGEVGLALAQAEIALDLQSLARGDEAAVAARAALPFFERSARADPRRAALERLSEPERAR